MPSVETIYQEKVLPLAPRERVRLAEIIMEHESEETFSSNGHVSALSLIENLPERRVFPNADSVDEHLNAERESWDN